LDLGIAKVCLKEGDGLTHKSLNVACIYPFSWYVTCARITVDDIKGKEQKDWEDAYNEDKDQKILIYFTRFPVAMVVVKDVTIKVKKKWKMTSEAAKSVVEMLVHLLVVFFVFLYQVLHLVK